MVKLPYNNNNNSIPIFFKFPVHLPSSAKEKLRKEGTRKDRELVE
jgi:hypothetical protein